MPASVQVKVVAARDLPIMDRSSELTDAFVELRLGHAFEKTDVCAKTLNPLWDSKWFTFKMDEEDLQEEPLQVRVMDHDTYSAHNAVGRVYIPLTDAGTALDGWFPIYDTLHGIRGEVRLIVKVEILKDQHRFRQSSCGIMFFTCPQTPSCYTMKAMHGFVEELVVNDDPEYKWIDKIRTPRASNEARQRLFSKLTGELQRKIGLKTIEVNGNAVIGYQQCFDLEGDTGIVVRGIGTCVSLIPKIHSPSTVLLPSNILGASKVQEEYLSEQPSGMVSPKPRLIANRKASSSDSDGTSSPNRGSGFVLAASGTHYVDGPMSGTGPSGGNLTLIQSSSDFPFYTLTLLPPGLLLHMGGIVSSRSVKLLDKIKDPDEPETRDEWWQEVRNEVRSHTQAMGCNAVIGYSESTSICDTLCILSAFGTAVTVKSSTQPLRKQISPGSSVENTKEAEAKESGVDLYPHCGVCHVSYSPLKLPSEGQMQNCSICNSHLVPSLILSTAEPPPGAAIRGHGTLIQVRVVLPKKRLKGDDNAIYISKQLPFLEHKLYTRLLNKVRIRGMNAVFCLQVQYTVGDTIIIAMATGTSVYLEALPPPSKLSISDSDKSSNAKQLLSIQDAFNKTQEENLALYDLKQPLDLPKINVTDRNSPDEDISAISELSLSSGRPEAFVFDVEDHLLKEEDIMEPILDRPLPKGFYASNTQLVPGMTPVSQGSEYRMITMVAKKSLETGKQHLEKQCAQLFNDLHQALAFKVRKASPCMLTRIRYDLDLPDDDMLQVAITAMVTRMQSTVLKSQSDEMIFCMEDSTFQAASSLESEKGREENKAGAVYITPLPFVSSHQVERYLRIINFFVIRESTSIRESGGLDSFMHLFTLEALAIARAHVAAIGGNTLLNFRLNDCVLIEHLHKNQAQCLLNVSGDAAVIVPSSIAANSTETTSTPVAAVATESTQSPASVTSGKQVGEKTTEGSSAGNDGMLSVPATSSPRTLTAEKQKQKGRSMFASKGAVDKKGGT